MKGQDIMHTLKTLLGFNGELFEPATGHCLLGNGYRAYSPVLMIFIQPDSWSPFGAGGLNAYAYCEGDPVNAADPTGHMPLPSPISVNGKLRLPPLTPEYIPPGSLISTDMKAFQYFANFGGPPPTIPATVAVSSPTGLAPAAVSPSRSQSPSPQPSPLASTSRTALASSRAHTEALPPIMGARNLLKQDAVDRRNQIVNKLTGMIKSQNTQAILELSNEKLSKSAVLEELYWQLPLSAEDRANTMTTQHGTPILRKFHLDWLVARARDAGNKKDMRFYRSLGVVTADPRFNGASRV